VAAACTRHGGNVILEVDAPAGMAVHVAWGELRETVAGGRRWSRRVSVVAANG